MSNAKARKTLNTWIHAHHAAELDFLAERINDMRPEDFEVQFPELRVQGPGLVTVGVVTRADLVRVAIARFLRDDPRIQVSRRLDEAVRVRTHRPLVAKAKASKVYWRPFESRGIQLWHCLEKDRVYVSLCGTATADRSHGQALNRPPLELRCPACNALEMMFRKADESLPASPDWEAAL